MSMFPSIRTLKSLHSLTGAGSHLIFVSRSCLAYPSVTSALVVWLQQFEISHHYSRETGGSRPPAGQIYWLLLVELSPFCSKGKGFQLVWALICLVLLLSTLQTYLHDLLIHSQLSVEIKKLQILHWKLFLFFISRCLPVKMF